MKAGGEVLTRKLRRIAPLVLHHVRPALEKAASELVGLMRQMAPEHLKPHIKWTWGAAPRGAFTIDRITGGDADLRITIYVGKRWAHWWEFGTADRYTKAGRYSGRITPQPFFWPAYRLLKRRNQRRIRTAMNRAVREAMAG